jgi:hypothetical protein
MSCVDKNSLQAILAWESPFGPKEKYTHLGFGFFNALCEMCNLVVSAHLGFTCTLVEKGATIPVP